MILWIVLLVFLTLIGLARVTPFEALIVRSGSMAPTIPTGGIVIVDRDARSPEVGSVASFRDPGGRLVTHRVVRIDSGRYITKGDANRTNDIETRPDSTVYGSVVFSLPLIGYVMYLLGHPLAFLVLLFGTGGFLIVDAVRTIAQELGRMRGGRRLADGP